MTKHEIKNEMEKTVKTFAQLKEEGLIIEDPRWTFREAMSTFPEFLEKEKANKKYAALKYC